MRYFRRKLINELERKREKIIMYKIMLMTKKIDCAICGGRYLDQPSKKRIHEQTNKHIRFLYEKEQEKRYTEAEVNEIVRRKLFELSLQ
jgi:hypothetical protein